MFEKLLTCMNLCITCVCSDPMLCLYGLPEAPARREVTHRVQVIVRVGSVSACGLLLSTAYLALEKIRPRNERA